MQELSIGGVTPGSQPHLVTIRGNAAYCYTCDEDIPVREDGLCPGVVQQEYKRKWRKRRREGAMWRTY